MLLVVCGFFIAVIICRSKKGATASQASPDMPVYECIHPVYECLNPTVTPVMTENEAYMTGCKELRAYEII